MWKSLGIGCAGETYRAKMYLSHRMRPIFHLKVRRVALTVKLKKEENHDPDALSGMLAAIDQGGTETPCT